MVDANRLTEEQIRKWFQIAVAMGGAPQTQFGARLGSQSTIGGASAAGTTSTGFGPAFGGRASAFGATGGFGAAGGSSSTVNAGGVTVNVNGARDPQATAREVRQEIDKYFRGINR